MQKNLIFVGIIFVAAVIGGYFILKGDEKLPIYSPADLNPDLVDKSLQRKSGGHKVSNFSLTSQLGETVTLDRVKGKIYVNDFFFTSCATICPKMTEQLVRVQKRFADNPDVIILSHSVTPDIDSVPKLKAYADKYGANPEKWIFLTGEKEEIYRLARKSYFAVVPGSQGAESGFIHTENFVLVDRQGRLRGFYDGTSTEDVNRLMDEIDILLLEKDSD